MVFNRSIDAGQMRSILSKQVSAFFSGIPPRADRSFFLWFVLALSGGTSFPGPPLSLDREHSGSP